MDPLEFKQHWDAGGTPTVPSADEVLGILDLSSATVDFLRIAGLPGSAAPWLVFSDNSYCVRLTQLYPFLPEEYGNFISLGCDGEGNPIVVDTLDDDSILWVDHEDGFAPRYMNTSIHALAVFLLAYRDFVRGLIEKKGDEAFLNCDFTDEELVVMKRTMNETDAMALEKGHFWNSEIQTLLANRAHYGQGLREG